MSYFIRMKKQSNHKCNLAGISKKLRMLAAFRDDKMSVLQNNLLKNFKMQATCSLHSSNTVWVNFWLCVTHILHPSRCCINIKTGVSDTSLCCCACYYLFSGSSSASKRFLRAPKVFMVSSPVAVTVTFSTAYRHSGNFRPLMPDV